MSTTTFPPGGTFVDSMKSFADVPVDAENANAISTAEFLDAANSLTTIFDLIGGMGFAFVKKDMVGNVEKVRERYLATPLDSQNLQDLVRNELKAGIHKATEGLLWLVRGLEFMCAALSANIDSTEELKDSFTNAYNSTLKKHHNFAVKALISQAWRATPYRKDFYAKMSSDQAKLETQMREYLKALDTQIGILKAFLESSAAKW